MEKKRGQGGWNDKTQNKTQRKRAVNERKFPTQYDTDEAAGRMNPIRFDYVPTLFPQIMRRFTSITMACDDAYDVKRLTLKAIGFLPMAIRFLPMTIRHDSLRLRYN